MAVAGCQEAVHALPGLEEVPGQVGPRHRVHRWHWQGLRLCLGRKRAKRGVGVQNHVQTGCCCQGTSRPAQGRGARG